MTAHSEHERRRDGALRSLAVAALLIAALSASGCQGDTTLLVEIEGALAVPADLDAVEVILTTGSGEEIYFEAFPLDARTPLPQSVLFTPGSYESTPLIVTVVGRLGGARGDEVARGSAPASFSPGEQVIVTVTLAPSCVDVECPDLMWCAADECVPMRCDDASDCDDGLRCNGVERCEDHACVAGTPLSCDDGLECTQDFCRESEGGCTAAPIHQLCPLGQLCDPSQGCLAVSCSDDTECDDGRACNGVETCVGGACRAGVAVACDDGVACTADLCNDADGSCVSLPRHDRCDIDELCSPDQGGCASPPCWTDEDCDDGFACNGAEICDSRICRAVEEFACDDGDPCTLDACLDDTAGCLHFPADEDRDGFVAATCGGGDCDDTLPSVFPGATETCDGVDESCDGAIDDGFTCALGATEPCETTCGSQGTTECVEGCVWGTCVEPEETCNGVDDDCDGFVDEDVYQPLPLTGRRLTDAPDRSVSPVMASADALVGLAWSDARHGETEVYFRLLDEAGAPVGDELRVTNAPGNSDDPSLIWTGEGFLVLWTDQRVGGTEIFAQAITVDGGQPALAGEPLQISDSAGNAREPVALWTGSAVGAFWTQRVSMHHALFFQRLRGDGSALNVARQITPDGRNASSPAVAWDGLGYGVAWTDADLYPDAPTSVRFGRATAFGDLGDILEISDGAESAEASVRWTGERFAIAYADHAEGPGRVAVALLDEPHGAVESTVIISSAGAASEPDLRWTSSELQLVWTESVAADEVLLARLTPSLGRIGATIVVTRTGELSNSPTLLPTSGGSLVAWTDARDGNEEIYSVLFGCP